MRITTSTSPNHCPNQQDKPLVDTVEAKSSKRSYSRILQSIGVSFDHWNKGRIAATVPSPTTENNRPHFSSLLAFRRIVQSWITTANLVEVHLGQAQLQQQEKKQSMWRYDRIKKLVVILLFYELWSLSIVDRHRGIGCSIFFNSVIQASEVVS